MKYSDLKKNISPKISLYFPMYGSWGYFRLGKGYRVAAHV